MATKAKSYKSYIPIKIQFGDQTLELGAKRLKIHQVATLRAKVRVAQNAKDDDAEMMWADIVNECFHEYIVLKPQDVEFADEVVKLRTPDDVLEFFGGDFHTMVAVVYRVLGQNGMDPEKKIPLGWLTAFLRSLEERSEEVPGTPPETIAGNAANGASADNGDAPNEAQAQCGSTEAETKTDGPQSSSTSVRSVH